MPLKLTKAMTIFGSITAQFVESPFLAIHIRLDALAVDELKNEAQRLGLQLPSKSSLCQGFAIKLRETESTIFKLALKPVVVIVQKVAAQYKIILQSPSFRKVGQEQKGLPIEIC